MTDQVVTIPLTRGQVALIDEEYAYLIERFKWQAKPTHSGYYAKGCVYSSRVYMHLYLWQVINGSISQDMEVDHINRNTLDNRLANLRLVTRRQNMSNQRRKWEGRTTSRFVGVYRPKATNKWHAQIQEHGSTVYLGRFDKEEDASVAYQKALAEIETQQRIQP